MEWHPLQEDFSAGELSPRLLARQSAPIYSRGLFVCYNMMPLPQGGLTRRPGTSYLTTLLRSDFSNVSGARVFPVQYNDEDSLIGLMGGDRIILLAEGDLSLRAQLLVNNQFVDGLTGWETFTSGIPAAYGPYVNIRMPPSWPPHNIPQFGQQHPGQRAVMRQTVNVTTANDEANLHIQHQRGIAFNGLPMRFKVSVASGDYLSNGGTELWSEIFVSTTALEQFFTNATVPLGTGFTGNLYIEMEPAAQFAESSYWYVYTVALTVDVALPATIPAMAIPYSDAELPKVQYIQAPHDTITIFVHPDHPPQKLAFAAGVWSFAPLSAANTPAWSASTGYPRACGAFQGRLLLAGWTDDPQRVVGSKPGDWVDFEVPASNPTASDGIDFTLTDIGIIQWVAGQKELLVGTVNAEHVVTTQTGILQAGDIDVRKQSAYGSRHMQPVDVGDQVMYITPDGRGLRAAEFNRDVQGWKSMDMTFASEHITKPGVIRCAYTRNPNQLIWCVTSFGALVGMSYERSVEVMGWHNHATDGHFVDCCTVRKNGQDVSVFAVRRTVDNEERYYIETMELLSDNSIHIDCNLRKEYGTATTTVAGLEIFEGKVVQVINDGAVEDDKVVESGAITLDTAGSIISVGLQCPAIMATMPAKVSEEIGGLGAKRSWSRVGVKLIDSALPKINSKRPAERAPSTKMDTVQGLATGDVFMTSIGWDNYGFIVVSQELPLPLTVTGIYGRLAAKNI